MEGERQQAIVAVALCGGAVTDVEERIGLQGPVFHDPDTARPFDDKKTGIAFRRRQKYWILQSDRDGLKSEGKRRWGARFPWVCLFLWLSIFLGFFLFVLGRACRCRNG